MAKTEAGDGKPKKKAASKTEAAKENKKTPAPPPAPELSKAVILKWGDISGPMLNVKYASLTKESCTFSFFERAHKKEFRQVDIKKSSTVVHEDLINAFHAFNGHLALKCEEVKKHDINDIAKLTSDIDEVEEILKRFLVQAVFFDGGISGSVVLYGHKILSTGDLLGLETPKININPEYLFFNELHAASVTLMEEVSLYYYGKAAPSAQQELFKQDVENQ